MQWHELDSLWLLSDVQYSECRSIVSTGTDAPHDLHLTITSGASALAFSLDRTASMNFCSDTDRRDRGGAAGKDCSDEVSGAGRTSDSYRATTELTWLTKKETACGFQTNESERECFTPKAT